MNLNASQLRDARDWLAECQWRDLEPEDIAILTDAQVERGIAEHYEGGVLAFLRADVGPTLTPAEVAATFCDDLPLSDLLYAGDPARREYRGFAAVGDLDDHNQLALNAGMPGPDGTQERLDLINACCEAISAEIITRYVAEVRKDRKGAAA